MKSETSCIYLKISTTQNIEHRSTNIIYEYFETSCRESAKEIIPIKEKLKKRTPLENQDIYIYKKKKSSSS